MTPWRVLESRTLIHERWLTLREQRVALPQGIELERFHVIETPDWVGMIALTASREVVCVEQYRHGAGRVSLELPAGCIEAGESAEEAARRELLEETGYEGPMEPLLSVYNDPNRHTARAFFFFSPAVVKVREQQLDPAERIAVKLIPAQELLRAIDGGQVIHSLHIGAVLMAARRGLL